MTRPRLLDLFCGAGGASAGYDVTGIDLDAAALCRYPGRAIRADAMDALAGGIDLDAFDAIHASPPCQAYSITRHTHDREHPDLVPAVVSALTAWGDRTGRPWVVENVEGSPMPGSLVLCGTEFELQAVDEFGRTLRLRRHRLFLSNVHLWGAGGCHCNAYRGRSLAGMYAGGPSNRPDGTRKRGGHTPSSDVGKALLGVPWMTRAQASQAIPPAYTRHIGEQLLDGWAT